MKSKLSVRRLLSLLTQLTVFLSASAGVWLCIVGNKDRFMGGLNSLMYFTIQSNIAIGLIAAFGIVTLLRGKLPGRIQQLILLMGTVAITLTGAVFCFVLAPTFKGNTWGITNILTHIVVPIASIAAFFLYAPDLSYRRRDAWWALLPPLLYVIYAGIGYVNRWEFMRGEYYPYFFLNWGSKAGAFGFSDELPFIGCVWWILLLLVFLLLVAFGYIAIAGWIRKKSEA